jgi:hypothetical protein
MTGDYVNAGLSATADWPLAVGELRQEVLTPPQVRIEWLILRPGESTLIHSQQAIQAIKQGQSLTNLIKNGIANRFTKSHAILKHSFQILKNLRLFSVSPKRYSVDTP